VTEATAEEGRHGIDVDAPAALPVNGDQARMEQALHGLIGNAVKFSPRGGRIGVRLEAGPDEVCLTVSDEGIGIPADEIGAMGGKAFVRGRRAEGYAGVGAGLYLARLIAEGHSGRLGLASGGEDRGTTAELIIPL